MTDSTTGRYQDPESTRKVDAKTLWSGGGATAIVAALTALVGILVCRWLFNVPILAPAKDGAWGNASTVGYTLSAAAAALVATALMHLLLISTPYPRVFFGWIMALAIVVAVVYPYSTTAPLSQKIATSVVNLLIGAVIWSLINEVSKRARRRYARYDQTTYTRTRSTDDDAS